MGIFSNIYGTVHGPKLRRKQFKAERAASHARIQGIEREMGFREKEDPREQAHLKQSIFARGLGKSSIHDQDRDRLLDIQRRRMEGLQSAHHVARRYDQYLRAKHKYQRKSQYAQYLDMAVEIAMSFATYGASSAAGGGMSQTNPTSGTSFGGGGMGGDFAGGGFA